jgi:hypothetical protein
VSRSVSVGEQPRSSDKSASSIESTSRAGLAPSNSSTGIISRKLDAEGRGILVFDPGLPRYGTRGYDTVNMRRDLVVSDHPLGPAEPDQQHQLRADGD